MGYYVKYKPTDTVFIETSQHPLQVQHILITLAINTRSPFKRFHFS